MKLIVCTNRSGMLGTSRPEVSLLYSFKSDMQRFKDLTSDNSKEKPVIIMGRKTYDTIGRPLPNRKNVIISRQKDLKIEGCHVMTLEECIYSYKDHPNTWVIGGAQLYELLMPYVTKAYVTHVSDSNVQSLEKEFNEDLVYLDHKDLLLDFSPVESTLYFKDTNRRTGTEHMITYINYERRN